MDERSRGKWERRLTLVDRRERCKYVNPLVTTDDAQISLSQRRSVRIGRADVDDSTSQRRYFLGNNLKDSADDEATYDCT